MGLIRSGYPRVRSYRRNGHTYYDVDCRKRGWNGPPRLSFSDKAAALAKARHIASTVGDHLHHALTLSYIVIKFCPWCGQKLPSSLRDEWFSKIEALNLEPNDPKIPAELLTGAWWEKRR